MEFGVWFTVDGGGHWVQLKGGIPTTQARDVAIQRRENDLVVGTFGRGVYVLDDYTRPARADSAVARPRRRGCSRSATPTSSIELGQQEAAWGNTSTPNPPYGAVFTYNVGQAPAADAKLVMNISDDTGKHVRRLDLSKEPGVHRIAWDLRGDPPAAGDHRCGRPWWSRRSWWRRGR